MIPRYYHRHQVAMNKSIISEKRSSPTWMAWLRIALCLLVPAFCPLTARAETRGMDVRLSYVHNYSNWGPTNAYGTARVWISEGVAMLAVHDLPHLVSGDTYGWWLVNTRTGDSLPLGTFNTTDAGDATVNDVFNQAPPQGADALVVTVMHPGDPAAAPGPLRSLAGFFPAQSAPQVPRSAATPMPVVPPTPTATPTRPATPARQQRNTTQPPAHHGAAKPLPARSGGRHQSGAHHTRSNPRVTHHIVVLPTTGGGPAARPCPRTAGHHHARYPCTRQ